MHWLIALLWLATAAAPAMAQVPARDVNPLVREVVRKIHTGMARQAGAPWAPSGMRLLVDLTVTTLVNGDSVAPRNLRDDDVKLVVCPDACEPTRPAEMVIRLGNPSFTGDRHASIEVEAHGIHPRRDDVPEHPWRMTTRYSLTRHGEQWIVVADELLLAS